MNEVNPVARTEIDPHFRNAFANRFHVAGIAERKTANPRIDS